MFKEIPADAGARRLASLKDISLDQVRDAIKTHFVPLFAPESSVMVVASATSLAENMAGQLKTEGYEVETVELPSLGDQDHEGGSSGSEDGDETMSSKDDASVSGNSSTGA